MIYIKSLILKSIFYSFLIISINILLITNLFSQPKTDIKDILKSVQEIHNKIKTIDCKIEITHDISSATITAIALLPFYDSDLNFKYKKPDNIEYWKYGVVGVFHTTSTAKIEQNKMINIVKIGNMQDERSGDAPIWTWYFLNIKEKIDDSINHNTITIENSYTENGRQYYVLKFVPADTKDKRPVCGREMLITVNYTNKRIEEIKGFLTNDISDSKTFEMKINYNNLPNEVVVIIKYPWCKTEIKYRFYNLIYT